MKKNIAVMFGIAMLCVLLMGNAGYAFDPNDLYTLQTTNMCPRCDLSGADLTGLAGQVTDLQMSNLSGANLNGVNLSNTDIDGANLSGANLSYANLTQADMCTSNLSGANLTGATVTGTYLDGATLDNATWVDGQPCQPGSVTQCNE
ncbi:MAG: pentapeptide repeat-containing protein [Syntrophobacteraceae bacterium]|jgi:uncharacterized protein YjbI with pentapeptide repeats